MHPVVGSADDWREPHTKLWVIIALIAAAAVIVFAVYWFVLRKSAGEEPGRQKGGSGKNTVHTEIQEVHPGLAGGALDVLVREVVEVDDASFETEGADYQEMTESDPEIEFHPHAVESTKPSNRRPRSGE